MNSIKLNAYAKVNLSLDIAGVLANGYHEMEMVMQSISLADEVTIELVEKDGLEVICVPEVVGSMSDNIATRSALAFLEYNNITEYGIRITIDKNIPSQAGLGGGSADGATVLVGLNKLFRKKLTVEELIEIGAKISADIPFCLVGSTAKVTGFGEIVTPIKAFPECHMVIVKPKFSVSTKEAFDKYDNCTIHEKANTQQLIHAIESSNLNKASLYFFNIFETVLADIRINDIKTRLQELNAIAPIMTGSGSAVFGLFVTEEEARECYFTLCNEGYSAYVACTINQ